MATAERNFADLGSRELAADISYFACAASHLQSGKHPDNPKHASNGLLARRHTAEVCIELKHVLAQTPLDRVDFVLHVHGRRSGKYAQVGAEVRPT